MLSLKENNTNADWHYFTIKDSIQNRIKKLITQNYIKYNNRKYLLNKHIIRLISVYLVDKNLKDLLTMPPTELDKFVTDLNLVNSPLINERSILYKIYYRVFVEQGYGSINNLEFINKIGIHTCPYCNRNYIYTLNKEGEIKPEIDHFYHKNKYPILGASFYNLIPSCQTCNGYGGKHYKDTYVTKITNPYLIKDGDFKFEYVLKSFATQNPLSGKSSIEINLDTKLQPHLDVFKLDELYKKHSDHALELYIKSRLKYSKKYRAYLNNYNGLKFSQIEIDRLILGNYYKESELHKRPLSMLYRDLGKQLGLI